METQHLLKQIFCLDYLNIFKDKYLTLTKRMARAFDSYATLKKTLLK